MGPKTTPSLISKGGEQISPPGVGRNQTAWEIGLTIYISNIYVCIMNNEYIIQFIGNWK